ncbi:MAG: EutN/CcmL family microcompartment protein [Elusimicrobiaceae bacterium]|nr:EutN/CcmL family microcompartment protein [Elusimicrobiaceae bacterium]
MFIAKVEGNVWATRKHDTLAGYKLLLVRAVDPRAGAAVGPAQLALDTGVGAGPGDTVLVLDEGGSARVMTGDARMPVRTVVCGVVDSVSFNGEVIKYA